MEEERQIVCPFCEQDLSEAEKVTVQVTMLQQPYLIEAHPSCKLSYLKKMMANLKDKKRTLS